MIRFKKILCPVDFFGASSRAFDYALRLAQHYRADVHALHVIAPFIPSAYGVAFSVADMTAELEKESKRLLLKLKTRADKAGVRLQTEIRMGHVDNEILETIRKRKADLLVMGTHGRRGFERLVIGSTTERMMRHSPIPLMTAGNSTKRTPPNIHRILVTTDFSDGTGEAVAHAFSIAQEAKAKVTLLHVIHDIANDVAGTYRETLVRGVETQLQKLIPPAAIGTEVRIETGLPWKRIADILRSGKFDLLVMNIHGKNILERVFVGSTAERTLRAAAAICPVLLIPPLSAGTRKKK